MSETNTSTEAQILPSLHSDVRERIKKRNDFRRKTLTQRLKGKFVSGYGTLLFAILTTVVVGVAVGSFTEYNLRYVKFLPFTTESKHFNVISAKMDNIELFKGKISAARETWDLFHRAPAATTDKEISNLDNSLRNGLSLFSHDWLKDIDANWQVYALYYYTYAQLMKLDFSHPAEKMETLGNAIESANKLEQILETQKNKLDYQWLNKTIGDLDRLFVYIHCQASNLHPQNQVLYEKAVLHLLKISQVDIRSDNLQEDRIIGRVLGLAIEEGKITL